MMSEKQLLAGLLCLLSFCSRAQEKDSTWYYANTLTDYTTADLVGLVRVGDTKILDTIGGYTIQEVSFEPIKFYKGKTEQRKFRAWLESHEVVWKAGTTHGYYLLKGTEDTADQESETYYWLENAGFAMKDTALLTKISDTGPFKQMVAQYILPDIKGCWAKVTLVELSREQHEPYGPITATIRLEEEVPALQLKKGSSVSVTIWQDAYPDPKILSARFQKKGTWEVILYREEDILVMKTAFMLEL
ncbi:MAG: hypothetical protein EOP54_01995 [Sphingobacteriales bacterium]|nr:MAG: hypothetical protein EOP54_01995 [Sphingobacteriales bacterium]